MNKFSLIFSFCLIFLLFSSCAPDLTDDVELAYDVAKNNSGSGSGSSSGSSSGDSETADEEVADEEVEEPDEPAEPAYPEVTATSNKEGDIAQNITIYDDVDVKHTLAEWYQPNNPSSKLIWLIFTTYDGSPCNILKEDLLEINLREYRDQGLKILVVFNGLLSGPQPELEPEKVAEYKDIYLSEYPDTGRFELYGYLKMEEQKVLHKFFSSPLDGAYPTWMFIDASTMELVEYGEGWSYNMVNSTKSKIEIFLEEL